MNQIGLKETKWTDDRCCPRRKKARFINCFQTINEYIVLYEPNRLSAIL